MAGTLTPFDMSQLPPPSVVETVDFEAIVADMLADLRARDSAFTATVESDPAYKVVEANAYREILLRARVNDVARRRLLAFATGSDLDQLAVFYGVQRLVLVPGNANASPPVLPVYEMDDAFRARIRERIMGSSAAGTAAWYRYHALTASALVTDVAVDSPAGGVVRVSVLSSEGDGTPSAETIQAVRDVVGSDAVRALCHEVQVVPVEIVTVNVVANIKTLPSSSITDLEAGLRAAFNQARGLGWDVTTSWLVARLQAVGVYSVELTAPAANVVASPFQCATLGSITLNFVGQAE